MFTDRARILSRDEENPKASKKVAIITGASAGLGKDFARQIATQYALDEVWLVARRKNLLDAFAKEIKNAISIELDLKDPHCHEVLSKKLAAENAQLQILVNNAGLGKLGPVDKLGLQEQLDMIDVNIRALTALTRALLPFIPSGGGILQVASCAAFNPSPGFAIYSATKSYVHNFSLALREELKEKNIRVLSVCPGPVETEFQTVAQQNEFKTDLTNTRRAMMARSSDVVKLALRDFEAGRSTSIYGWPMKIYALLVPFAPKWLVLPLIAKRNRF